MKILFLGDIVGLDAVKLVRALLPGLRQTESFDLVVANAENTSGGSGLYPKDYRHLRSAGIDVVTMGDHIYKKMEIIEVMNAGEPICKPANYPPEAPGREVVVGQTASGVPYAVISLMGRTFMRPVDCPFHAATRVLATISPEVKTIFVDVHAEATGDKFALLHHLRGKISAMVGTHTHVQTGDEQILADGTAFLSDAGMCGPHSGVLGRKPERILPTHLNFVPIWFDLATDDIRLSGCIIDTDDATGRATNIRRVQYRPPTPA